MHLQHQPTLRILRRLKSSVVAGSRGKTTGLTDNDDHIEITAGRNYFELLRGLFTCTGFCQPGNDIGFGC
jgi:hypothetical protein